MKVRFEKTAHLHDGKYWAEYKWNSNTELWECWDGKSSEGFFYENVTLPRRMTDNQMLLLSMDNS